MSYTAPDSLWENDSIESFNVIKIKPGARAIALAPGTNVAAAHCPAGNSAKACQLKESGITPPRLL
jgi:hypothetical protein